MNWSILLLDVDEVMSQRSFYCGRTLAALIRQFVFVFLLFEGHRPHNSTGTDKDCKKGNSLALHFGLATLQKYTHTYKRGTMSCWISPPLHFAVLSPLDRYL